MGTSRPPKLWKNGDWVMQRGVTHRPIIGKVREVWEDDTIDIVVYSHTGEKLGRVSPPEGGPTSYEPSVTASNYQLIREPAFPIKLDIRQCWRYALVVL